MSSAEQQAITVDVDHNPYLAEGSGTVDAIVSITVGGERPAEPADSANPLERVEAIIVDCSTSMQSPAGKFDACHDQWSLGLRSRKYDSAADTSSGRRRLHHQHRS